ncbi:helix-turn-helix domain-containing protein [Bacillus thuringiensis]|nr:helix-turn-helix domain-containing protein [Bacillus thuringiensis]
MYGFKLIEPPKFEVKIQSEIKRKKKIIQFISLEKRWYTFDEISEFINVSKKTISRDLVCIQDIIPYNWSIKIKKGYGVQLFMPVDATVNEITAMLFRKSLTFQILNKFLVKGETTVVAMAEELHIHPQIVTKALKKIEKDIFSYDLKLQRNPLRIVGDEWKIIFMYTELYTNSYTCSEWPFQYNKEFIWNFIKKIENSLEMVLYLSSRRYFLYYMAILLIRKQQGYETQWIDGVFNLNVNTPQFNAISKKVDEFGENINVSFLYSEKAYITIVYKCLNYVYVHPDKNKEKDIQLFNERTFPIYNIIRDFVDSLYEKLKYQFIREEKFVHTLILHFRKRIYLLHFYPYIKNLSGIVSEYLKKNHLKTFLQVKEIYNKWIKRYGIANYVSDQEIMNIVIYIESARIRYHVKPKKAIIVTKEGDCWKEYISAVLKDRFGNRIEFPNISSMNLAKELDLEAEYDIDFILCTFPLKIESHPVIQIQPFITERDLHNIDLFINETSCFCCKVSQDLEITRYIC